MLYVQTLIRWELFDKRKEAYDQLKTGLNVLNFLDQAKDLQDFDHLFLCRSKNKTKVIYLKKKLLKIGKVQKLKTQKEKEDSKNFKLLKDLKRKYSRFRTSYFSHHTAK
jgi:hypothetical protein